MESAAAITAKSEKDAFPLVREVLSRANFERKALNGLYIPSKVVPGRTYRFKLNQKIDVLEDGTNIGYLCVGTDGRVLDPVEEAICLYLNLVLDEAGLLRTANLRALPTRMISLWPRE